MNPKGDWVRRVAVALCYAAVFLIVAGAKLSLVWQYARPHPFWDAWHVEGQWLYRPFLTGTLHLQDLFSAASEHRPVVLRLYDLCLIAINGQWDVQLQMVVNAFLFAITACLLFGILGKALGHGARVLLGIAISVFFILPFGWENTLNGHHAGWFFFYLFSLAALWLMPTGVPLSGTWLLGLCCAMLSYFSLAAGLSTFVAAAGAMVFRMCCDRRMDRRAWGAVALLAMVAAVLLGTQPRFAGQAAVQAASVAGFMKALGLALAWPYFEITGYGLALHVPTLVLLILLLIRKVRCSGATAVIVAMAFWCWLQAAGMAYARGQNGVPPAPRYMDLLMMGLLVAFSSILIIGTAAGRSRIGRLGVAASLVLWLYAGYGALDNRTRYNYVYMLAAKRSSSLTQQANLRGFLATRDRAYLDNKGADEISYYAGADQLAAYLNDPVFASVLPVSIRAPLSVRWTANGAFIPDGYPSTLMRVDPAVYGSFNANGPAATGTMESAWIAPPRLPFLDFRVAGDLNQPGISLQLMTASGETYPIRPDQYLANTWMDIRVPAPRVPFRIVATDVNASAWLAFSLPREMGRLSVYADNVASGAAGFSWAGYVCGLLFFAAEVAFAIRRPLKKSTTMAHSV